VPLTDAFSRLGGEVLKVEGQDRGWLAIVTLNFASLVGFGILLTRLLHSPAGMAWANYLLLGNWVMAWRVGRILGKELWRLAADLLFLYVLPLPFFLAAAWLFPADSWSRFAASLVAAALAGALYLLRFWRPFRDFFVAPRAPVSPGAP
jgi:hypothetical protein